MSPHVTAGERPELLDFLHAIFGNEPAAWVLARQQVDGRLQAITLIRGALTSAGSTR